MTKVNLPRNKEEAKIRVSFLENRLEGVKSALFDPIMKGIPDSEPINHKMTEKEKKLANLMKDLQNQLEEAQRCLALFIMQEKSNCS